MGKAGGTVTSGKTKDECWHNFAIEHGKAKAVSLVLDYPKSKAEAYEQMKQDPVTGEWVLEYHFSA